MKKYILLALMAAVTLTACKTTKSVSKKQKAAEPVAVQQTAAPADTTNAQEKLSLGDIFRMIQEVEEATSNTPRDQKPVGEEVVTPETTKAPAAQTDLEKALAAQPTFHSAYGRGSLTLNYQQHTISLQGSITIKTGELILVSVQVPILGVEMMRAEIDQEGIIVLDKINKIYIKMTYAELAQRAGYNISFAEVEAIFMNHMFMLGTPSSELTRYLKDQSGHVFTATKDGVEYRFTTNDSYALIESTFKAGNKQATATYSNHQLVSDVRFPMQIQASLTGSSKDATIGVKLNQVSFNGNINTNRLNPEGYRQTDASTILGKLY